MTSLAEERAEQERWNACALGDTAPHRALVEHEFEAPEISQARAASKLSQLLQFSAQQVPYYGALFERVAADANSAESFECLRSLPVLGKLEVYEHADALQAKGERVAVVTQSSGTTGRPTRVKQTAACAAMFSRLMQRHYRWFCFDPKGKMASIRLSSQLPGQELSDGATGHFPAWQYLRYDFRTGPFICFSVTNSVESQIEWLRGERPDYLVSYSESLEHLSFAAGDDRPADSLRALIAISEQLTDGMRERISRSFGVPIHQGYGLNEIGIVACRCEAGRYHVHTEHCLVEILDDKGAPVPPGEKGRVIVTSLTNYAMPLLRYDTGDLAQAVAGDCPCGRTLPAFGEIVGRYSRIAYLPDGTLGWADILRRAVEEMPVEFSRDLRQFQIHQYRDGRFELRLAAKIPLPESFTDRVRTAWAADARTRAIPLAIVEVPEIHRSPGGKFQVFTSDFMPGPEAARGTPAT